MDRLERLFEQYTERNEEEHKRLLTSQILMVDTMTRLETRVIEIADKQDGLIGVVDGFIKKLKQ